MLKKLLKYDFIAVYRYWWIAALVSFVLSLCGGGCISILTTGKTLPTLAYFFSIMFLVIIIISYVVFSILSTILVLTRFYKNFFTDEGYLTFTLPVKRSQLLNSKLILGITTAFLTSLVCIINVFVMLLIGFNKELLANDVVVTIWQEIQPAIQSVGINLAFHIPLLLLTVLFSSVFSNLLMYFCITFACIITQKAKVITAIGIYFGINTILSIFTQFFSIFSTIGITSFVENSDSVAATLLLVVILLYTAIGCVGLYTLEYWLIDRKLNLN